MTQDRIPFGSRVDLGDVEAARAGQGGGEQGRAADDADLVRAVLLGGLAGDLYRLVQIGADHGALGHAVGS